MPLLTPEYAKQRRLPKSHPISASDPKPRTQSLPQSSTRRPTISTVCQSPFSNTNDLATETRRLLTKKPKKKRIFTSLTLKGLGCWASSAEPAVIRSAVDWEAEKLRKKKKKKKQRKTTTSGGVVVDVVGDVCCGPGVGIASDVVPTARVADAEKRTNHRVRSCQARRRTANVERVFASDLPSAFDANHARLDASNERGLHRLRPHSPVGLPQIVMFQHNLLSGGNSDRYDQYGDWRLDVDTMSYEELLDLSDRIGYVGTGLREDEIFRCLRKTKHSILESLPLLMSTYKDWKCSICQEGWKADYKMGRLDCGHLHHLHCIKQWLLLKNACPVCKTAAVAHK